MTAYRPTGFGRETASKFGSYLTNLFRRGEPAERDVTTLPVGGGMPPWGWAFIGAGAFFIITELRT